MNIDNLSKLPVSINEKLKYKNIPLYKKMGIGN